MTNKKDEETTHEHLNAERMLRMAERDRHLKEIREQLAATTKDDKLISSLSLREFILETEQLLDRHPDIGGCFIFSSRETGEGSNILLNITPQEVAFGLCNVVLTDFRLMQMLAMALDMVGQAVSSTVGHDKLRELVVKGNNGVRHAAVSEGLRAN